MSAWLSMMPVAVDSSAASPASAGSSVARLGAAQPAQSLDAVGERAPLDRAQQLDLRRRRRDDELAAAPVADAARFAVRIEQAPAGDAEPRLQRRRRVVEAGVDDFAVARAGAVADAGCRLEHDRLAAAQRQLARDREADRAGPDDDGIDAVHRSAPARRPGRRLAQSR